MKDNTKKSIKCPTYVGMRDHKYFSNTEVYTKIFSFAESVMSFLLICRTVHELSLVMHSNIKINCHLNRALSLATFWRRYVIKIATFNRVDLTCFQHPHLQSEISIEN